MFPVYRRSCISAAYRVGFVRMALFVIDLLRYPTSQRDSQLKWAWSSHCGPLWNAIIQTL